VKPVQTPDRRTSKGAAQPADAVKGAMNRCAGTGPQPTASAVDRPESRFPAAHDDTDAAYLWVRANAVSFYGMSAPIAIRARDEGVGMRIYQLLIYPITSHPSDTPVPLSTRNLVWYNGIPQLFGRCDNPEFSVLRANLKGLQEPPMRKR
jgi:hypothetical protein